MRNRIPPMKRPICMESFPDMPPEEPFLEVEDENGKYRLSREIVEFAKQLDGKINPYLVDPSLSVRQVEHYLQTLEKYDLIWEAADNFGDVHTSITNVYALTSRNSPLLCIAKAANALIHWTFFPMLLLGFYFFEKQGFAFPAGDAAQMGYGMASGILAATLLHTLAHFAAWASEGQSKIYRRVYPWPLPRVTLTMEPSTRHPSSAKLHPHVVGMEMNGLLFAVCIAVSRFSKSSALAWHTAAVMNLIWLAVNCIPFSFCDGRAILEHVLGIPDLSSYMKVVLKNPDWKNAVAEKGFHGTAAVIFCRVFAFLQVIVLLAVGVGLILLLGGGIK